MFIGLTEMNFGVSENFNIYTKLMFQCWGGEGGMNLLKFFLYFQGVDKNIILEQTKGL